MIELIHGDCLVELKETLVNCDIWDRKTLSKPIRKTLKHITDQSQLIKDLEAQLKDQEILDSELINTRSERNALQSDNNRLKGMLDRVLERVMDSASMVHKHWVIDKDNIRKEKSELYIHTEDVKQIISEVKG